MNIQELLRGGDEEPPTKAALIGIGQFGRTLLAQSTRTAAMALPVLCERDLDRAVDACDAAGIGRDRRVVAETPKQARAAFESGRTVITPDATIAIGLPVDVVVEATGDAEAGARNCEDAIEKGRHVVLVTKETDCVIGPVLSLKARRAGVVVSQVDGDQPSLLLGLISWARTLGLEIACAGKASEYDFVFDPERSEVCAEGLERGVPVDFPIWDGGGADAGECVRQRASALAAIPQRTPPDFCEMCLVANGSGLMPDRPELHAVIARPSELPDIFRRREAGGILGGGNALDIFNCLRRSDEISFAGGVFAVLKVPDEETGSLFQAKGIPVSTDRSHVLVYNPTHLLGVEAPLSVMTAHRLKMATGSTEIAAICDVAMRATRDLQAGAVLAGQGHHHRIEGVEPLLTGNAKLTDGAPLPYFMGMDRTLTRAVRRGEIVPFDAVELPEGSRLWALRLEQDGMGPA